MSSDEWRLRIHVVGPATVRQMHALHLWFPELISMKSEAQLRDHLATAPVYGGYSRYDIALRRDALAPVGVLIEQLCVAEPETPLPVWIQLSGPPTAAQLRALRARFPRLANHPLSALRDHLARWPRIVVERCLSDELEAARRELEPLGVGVDWVPPYGVRAVRDALPGPPQPDWDDAEATLEVVFLHAFDPEVVLRAWSREGRGWLQLASAGTLLWAARYPRPPWLFGACDEVPPEQASSEVAEVSGIDSLLEAAHGLPRAPTGCGLDGIVVAVHSRHHLHHVFAEAWSPSATSHPEMARMLTLLRARAESALAGVASRARLAELAPYFGR